MQTPRRSLSDSVLRNSVGRTAHQYDVGRAAAPRDPLVEVGVRQVGVLQVVPQHAVTCNTHAGTLQCLIAWVVFDIVHRMQLDVS